MAKKSRPHKKKTPAKQPFVAGWLFWAVVSVVLSVVFCYLLWQVRHTDQPVVPFVVGILLGTTAGGIITWLVNELLHFVRRKKQKHTGKKAKRKA